MKRLILLFVVFLVLSGCGKREMPVPVTTEVTVPTTVPEPKNLYVPGHPIEKQTNGAVRVYQLEGNNYTGVVPMGEKLLLVSEDTHFSVLHGDQGERTCTVDAAAQVSTSDPAFSVTVMGLSYFLEDSREVVFLNPMLKETSRITLPQDAQGRPAVSLETGEVYFCQGQEIRAQNTTTGISRLVKSQSCKTQELVGSYFGGNLLACQVTDLQGEVQTVYLNSQTGQTIATDEFISHLKTYEDRYFCRRMDGALQQQIFGAGDAQPQNLNLQEAAHGVLSLAGAVTSRETTSGRCFDFYQLRDGRRSGSVELPPMEEPVEITSDSTYVWILTGKAEGQGQLLLRWDVSQTPVTDELVYAGPVYTAEHPDTEAIAQCKARAEQLGKQHGVKILLGKKAVEQTGGYTLSQEYQAPAIEQMLEGLEKVLPLFPEGFLKSSIQGGSVRICLVRTISDGLPYAQFYKNGDAYILLALDSEVQRNFIRAFAYVVDSHVLGNSRDYDTWDQLNPPGFSYDEQYRQIGIGQDTQYIEGKNRAFVDQISMSDPREDRSRIFLAAMTPGNERMFEAPIMQKKLLRMCEGIREAYGFEKKSESYLWEQYLHQSLAYQK